MIRAKYNTVFFLGFPKKSIFGLKVRSLKSRKTQKVQKKFPAILIIYA